MRFPRRGNVALLSVSLLAGGVLIGGCGSSKPAFCSHVSELEKSVKSLGSLNAQSGVSGLEAALRKVELERQGGRQLREERIPDANRRRRNVRDGAQHDGQGALHGHHHRHAQRRDCEAPRRGHRGEYRLHRILECHQVEVRLTDHTESEQAGRLWWMALLLGLISIAVGILALAYPKETLTTIAIIFGIYLLLAALVQLALAFGESERSRGALLLSAAVAGIAGIIVIRHPGGSVQVVALAFGIYLVIMGMMRLYAAVYAVGGRGWLMLWGIVDLAAGILIVAWPKFGVATLAVVLSIVLLARGIVLCALAFVVRAATREAA